jgi:hypothetical protein
LLARFLLSHEEKSYYETYTCLDRTRDFLIVAIDGGNKHCRVVPVQFRRKPSASRFPELGVRDWDHQRAAMSTIQCNRSSTTGRWHSVAGFPKGFWYFGGSREEGLGRAHVGMAIRFLNLQNEVTTWSKYVQVFIFPDEEFEKDLWDMDSYKFVLMVGIASQVYVFSVRVGWESISL